MKKLLLFTLLALLFSTGKSNAQLLLRDSFYIGPVFGLDLTSYRYKIPDDKEKSYSSDPLISLNLNLAIQYRLTKYFALAVEPGFIQKGYSNYKPSYDRIMNNYFQLPVLLNVDVYKGISLLAGAEIDYHLKTFISHGNVFDRFPAPENKKEFALLLGAKCAFSPDWSIGIRYSHGLSVMDEVTLSNVGTAQISNRYFQLALFHNW